IKATVIGPELSYNKEFVEYFGTAPGESHILMVNLTRSVKDVFMDSRVDNEDSKRVAYKVQNFFLCNFLNNRLVSKLYSFYYEEFVGNGTVFKCPIRPGIYYLKNSLSAQIVPSFHPTGKFRLTVRLKSEKSANFSAELIWRYRV
ncbi:hypothetical protein KR018_000709, partial [Drosophila ironensis]